MTAAESSEKQHRCELSVV